MFDDLYTAIKSAAKKEQLSEFILNLLWSKEQEEGNEELFCIVQNVVFYDEYKIYDNTGELIIEIDDGIFVNNLSNEDYLYNNEACNKLANLLTLIVDADKVIKLCH